MEQNNDTIDLGLPEIGKKSAVFTYIKIMFLPVVIYLVFLLGYFKIISFKVELHSIIMMGFLLLIAFVFARHSAEYGTTLFERDIAEFKKNLKQYILSHILNIGEKARSNAAFEQFVDEFCKDLRNDNYASVAAGVFPMLGILGTFISIAISMPEFSSQNVSALESEISVLLSGVGTAFYVSIYGIFLALWSIYFEKKGLSRFERLVCGYKNSTKEFFWNKDEISQAFMQEILDKNTRVARSFEIMFNTDVAENLNRAMAQKFAIFEKLIEAETQAVHMGANELNRVSELILSSNNLQYQISNTYSEILSVLNKFNFNISNMQESFSREYDRLSEIMAMGSSRFDSSVVKLTQNLSSFEGSIKKMGDDLLNNQKVAMDAFKSGLVNGLNDFKDSFSSEEIKDETSTNILEELRKSLCSLDDEVQNSIQKSKKQL